MLPVFGAAWLQGAALDMNLLLFSLPVSAWVTAILLINEVPDIAADAATGKRTLPVRLGLRGTAMLYLAIHVSAVAAVTWMTISGALPLLSPLVPLGLLLLVGQAAKAIGRGISDRPAMTKAIESTLAIHALGTVWLSACVLFTIFRSTV